MSGGAPARAEQPEPNPAALAVFNLQKEVNVGHAIRAASAGALAEVVVIGRKHWNRALSVGIQSSVKITRLATIAEFSDYCAAAGYAIVAVEIGAGAVEMFSCVYPERPIFVIGNEGQGVAEQILHAARLVVRIPQYGEAPCLSAGMAATVVTYDWLRKCGQVRERGVSGTKYGPAPFT